MKVKNPGNFAKTLSWNGKYISLIASFISKLLFSTFISYLITKDFMHRSIINQWRLKIYKVCKILNSQGQYILLNPMCIPYIHFP